MPFGDLEASEHERAVVRCAPRAVCSRWGIEVIGFDDPKGWRLQPSPEPQPCAGGRSDGRPLLKQLAISFSYLPEEEANVRKEFVVYPDAFTSHAR